MVSGGTWWLLLLLVPDSSFWAKLRTVQCMPSALCSELGSESALKFPERLHVSTSDDRQMLVMDLCFFVGRRAGESERRVLNCR